MPTLPFSRLWIAFRPLLPLFGQVSRFRAEGLLRERKNRRMCMALDLQTLFGLGGRVALVTGAAQGMGERVAHYLSGVGAAAALADVQSSVDSVAETLRESGASARSYIVDMADDEAVTDLVHKVRADFGRIDIVVNCAGLQDRNFIEDTSTAFWDRMIDVNLRGPFVASREAVKIMRADGTKGRIINIASNSAFHATAPSLLAYSTSKAGVAGLTRATAMEVVKDGITVNAVCPGNTATPGQMTSTGPAFPPEQIAAFMPPIGRAGTPDDIAGAVLYLASDAAGFITGQTLVIDGGQITC
jgi:NAD(P)-dependent dehydrogenase (short-subunit alcohol dehydrogenase family)